MSIEIVKIWIVLGIFLGILVVTRLKITGLTIPGGVDQAWILMIIDTSMPESLNISEL